MARIVTEPFVSDIPARLDRLPWSRFHLLIAIALGVTWVLDGLEVTIVGALGGVLQDEATLHLTGTEIGTMASAYVVGAVIGALAFGWLTDRVGRRRMFFVTLAIYLVGVLLSAFSWNFASFAIFRLITGLGIGGEYAAINSAIDEMMPARLRGRIDLIINGSFWIGAALGSGVANVVLDTRLFPVDLGWRLGFAIGAVLGCIVLFLRRWVPESPRWLLTHGYREHAEANIAEVERRAGVHDRTPPETRATFHPRQSFGLALLFHSMFVVYRRRTAVVLVLMASQAFLYNAIFFTLALVLTKFYAVPPASVGSYILPFAAGNFLGPLVLGRWFDTIGRRAMIAGTYTVSGVLLAITALLFAEGRLTVDQQVAAWSVIFFFASAAASAAYLSAGELFPLEIRALAIAAFYAAGTGVGGVIGPYLFGRLVDTGSRWALSTGYLAAAALMLIAAAVQAVFGVDAERQPLEAVAVPLSARDQHIDA
ncbi:MAG TPA: MFS transporter [Stellaceae bacterium]|nr:MFS transporter [Stellaceae bacterium]